MFQYTRSSKFCRYNVYTVYMYKSFDFGLLKKDSIFKFTSYALKSNCLQNVTVKGSFV